VLKEVAGKQWKKDDKEAVNAGVPKTCGINAWTAAPSYLLQPCGIEEFSVSQYCR